MIVSLVPHPSVDVTSPHSIAVHVERRGDALWLRFAIEGDVDAIAWPARAPAARADDLWRRTCLEAFVSGADDYVEYNLSPSGQWATYRFDRYREGMRPAAEAVVIEDLHRMSGRAALEARIELPPGVRRLGLSAVVEATDGTISYWALAHPSDKPDFHHPDSFTLEIP